MAYGLRRGTGFQNLIALTATQLALAACSPATSVTVGPQQTSQDCEGGTSTSVGITVQPARSGIPGPAIGAATVLNVVNMSMLLPRVGYNTPSGVAHEYLQGEIADTCKPASFDVAQTSSVGPAPTPADQHVALPALGYQAPEPTLSLGPGLTLQGSGTVLNCSAQPLTFTITTTPAGSVAPGAAVRTTSLVLAPGAQGAYPIAGANAVDQVAQAWYAVQISAPGVPGCTTSTGRVQGALNTLPATNSQ
ncbi:MAG TPA: hypothetical protein VGL58_16315 [Caulobacteraceae bacterium]|jgi:hypothetical protein